MRRRISKFNAARFWERFHGPAGLWALFGGALLIRLGYLWELRRFPLFRIPIIDAEKYDQWARAILGGDWLGQGVFYQDPLYPYLLAVVYGIFFQSLVVTACLQAALDAAGVVLLARLGRRAFSPAVGGLAALGAAVFGVCVFYTAVFEKTTVALFATVLALSALELCAEKPERKTFAWAGAALGAALLIRGNFYLFVLPAAIWLAWTQRRARGYKAAALAAAFAGGLAVTVLPVTARNWIVGRDFVLTTSQGGWNFYRGNSPESTGWLAEPRGVSDVPRHEEEENHALAEREAGRKLKPSQVSRYWTRQALAYILGHPGDYLVLLARKARYLINAFELPDSYDYYYFRRHSLVLKLLPLGFGLVFPLGLAGLLLALRRGELDARRGLFALFLAVYAGSILLFYAAGRYRLPLAPVLLLFGAYGLDWLAGRLRAGDYRSAGGFGALLLGLALLSRLHVAAPNFDGSVFAEANALLQSRYPAAALERFESLLPRNQDRPELQFNRALALRRLGRRPESIAGFRRAWLLAPEDERAYAQLRELYGEEGDLERARMFAGIDRVFHGEPEKGLEALLELGAKGSAPVRLEAYDFLGFTAHRIGRPDIAEYAWDEYLKLKPDNAGILLNLFLLNEDRSPAKALSALRRHLALIAGKAEPARVEALRERELALESRLRAARP